MRKLLLVDSEYAVRTSLKELLEYESFHVDVEDTGSSAFERICTCNYDVVLSDIQHEDMDTLTLMDKLRKVENDVPFIVIMRDFDLDTVVKYMRGGASYMVQKPIDINKLLHSINELLNTQETVQAQDIKSKKRIRLQESSSNFTKMIGQSEKLKDMIKLAERVAPTNEKVLITGENGVGKELVAQMLHEFSKRRDRPFITVNCAAIPSELIESQLFGHEKGSFTSAIKMHKGDFEQADGGTLFLDEIGDMSMAAQAKILRALQEKKITRVGGEKSIPIDVRVISATNKNLKKEIAEGRFREDLFHRLSVIEIRVPSLRERKEDIPILADYFLDSLIKANERNLVISDEAMEKMKNYAWSGNVRELENAIERLYVFCDDIITEADVEKYLYW
ncbi:MAG: sigma-54-dependent Fis family transcriptional regulator [Bacteroidales bacterium]|nr:sigma-54-dependent Fis family transcriptional regulator [Bacteroidales bacterium]